VARDYLPRGNTLDPEAFRRRHQLLSWVLALHLPALFAFGVWQGYGVEHAALEIAPAAACLMLAQQARNRRLAAFFVTGGLVFCSSVLVHLSGGTIEAHFHFFVIIGLIALYQDWVPFLWNVVFVVLSHGLGSAVAADLVFNHPAAQSRPWSWAVVHGAAVLAACIGVVVFWKNTEMEQRRSARLATELATAEVAAIRAEVIQRESISQLFANLARRNQSLLDRQLHVIAALQQHEQEPGARADLVQLDHLATRIRRNAESLLVLSGAEPPRLWGRPVPLADVVHAAATEVEDHHRVGVLVSDYLDVTGRVVADFAHLLAELLENATMFSAPTSEVRVRTHPVPAAGPRFLLSIEDTGIGMSDADLRAANEELADPPEVDPSRSTLGFHVVSRLAQRLGLGVSLAHTPGGGVTALVTLPDDLISARSAPAGTAALELTAPPGPAGAPAHAEPPGATAMPRPPAVAPPWAPEGAALVPAPAGRTAAGLVRRVPGASLAPSQPGAPLATTGGSGTPGMAAPSGTPGTEAPSRTPGTEAPSHSPPDELRSSSMLSRFQAAQRAGRAFAAAPLDPRTAQEPR
jgi:signal transduction histidine kinase